MIAACNDLAQQIGKEQKTSTAVGWRSKQTRKRDSMAVIKDEANGPIDMIVVARFVSKRYA